MRALSRNLKGGFNPSRSHGLSSRVFAREQVAPRITFWRPGIMARPSPLRLPQSGFYSTDSDPDSDSSHKSGWDLPEADSASSGYGQQLVADGDFVSPHIGNTLSNTYGGPVVAPTEKQLAFATKLAERAGCEIPQEALSDAVKISAFIDKQLSSKSSSAPGSDEPPSEKQIAYASYLLARNGSYVFSDHMHRMKSKRVRFNHSHRLTPKQSIK